MSNDNNKVEFANIASGKYRVLVKIPEHHLTPGIYIPNIAIRNNETGETYERILANTSFRVKSDGNKLERGFVNVDEQWEIVRLSDEIN